MIANLIARIAEWAAENKYRRSLKTRPYSYEEASRNWQRAAKAKDDLAKQLETISITKSTLESAFITWEQAYRNGNTKTYAETQALPPEQVAAESAEYLWSLLAVEVPA